MTKRPTDDETEHVDERLPFDVHVERMPPWGTVAAALVCALATLAALRLLPTIVLTLPLVVSGIARRFAVSPRSAVVDAEGLWLGDELATARADVTDAWFDADDHEIRVTIAARPDRLLVVHLANAGQARRFVRALEPAAPHAVAGHRPRAIDALGPLRFVTVGLAFVASGGWPGLLLVVFAVPGILAFVRGAQVDAGDDALEIRRAHRLTRVAYGSIGSVDADASTMRLTDGKTITVRHSDVRDPLLGAGPWTRRAHARFFARVRERVEQAKEQATQGAK